MMKSLAINTVRQLKGQLGVIFYTIPGLDSSKMLRSNMIEKG